MEDFKTIKLELNYFDENNIWSKKLMTAKVNTLKDEREKVGFGRRDELKYSLSFSMSVPKHVHEYLLNKSVYARDGERTYKEGEFKKTINAETIARLCDLFNTIMSDYTYLKSIDGLPMVKVIFYSIHTLDQQTKSQWNSSPIGITQNINYRFCVGYIVVTEKGGIIRYNENKQHITEYYDKEFYRMSHVDYTEKRYDFFKQTYNSFNKVINQINLFSNAMTEDIDVLIYNNQKLIN